MQLLSYMVLVNNLIHVLEFMLDTKRYIKMNEAIDGIAFTRFWSIGHHLEMMMMV